MTERARRACAGVAALLCGVACLGIPTARGTVLSYVEELERIDADYRVARRQCEDVAGQAGNVCVAEARAARRIAQAEATARMNKGTPKARYDASVARAEAQLDVAKERCRELAGYRQEVCIADARAAEAHAKESARIARQEAETSERLRAAGRSN